MKKKRVSCKRGASGPAVRRDTYKNKTARSVWTRWLVSFVEKVGQSVRQVGRQAGSPPASVQNRRNSFAYFRRTETKARGARSMSRTRGKERNFFFVLFPSRDSRFMLASRLPLFA